MRTGLGIRDAFARLFEGLRELIAGVTSKQTQDRLMKSAKLSGIDLKGWPRTGLK